MLRKGIVLTLVLREALGGEAVEKMGGLLWGLRWQGIWGWGCGLELIREVARVWRGF